MECVSHALKQEKIRPVCKSLLRRSVDYGLGWLVNRIHTWIVEFLSYQLLAIMKHFLALSVSDVNFAMHSI